MTKFNDKFNEKQMIMNYFLKITQINSKARFLLPTITDLEHLSVRAKAKFSRKILEWRFVYSFEFLFIQNICYNFYRVLN